MFNIKERYEQMYEFENDSRLYDFRFRDTGIPMWMYIRALFITSIVNPKEKNRINNIWKQKMSRSFIKKSISNKYIIRNPFLSCRKDILFGFWGYSELLRHDDGRVFEDFIMPFLQMFPDNTTTLMDGRILNKYELECVHPNWKMDDIFMDILKMCRMLKKKQEINVEDRKNIKGLINFLNHGCPLSIDKGLRREIVTRLEDFSRNSRQMIKICENYLRVVKPKVAVICCASYPNILRISMILACRNKNVVTAELQHGLIARYHAYYQYCDYILNSSECRKMLPDYYLTFGEYWNSQVQMPQQCDVIGYAKPIIKDKVKTNNKILLCANANFDVYINFLNIIMPKLEADTEIYFRLHPGYSTKMQRDRLEKYMQYPNFCLADGKDLSFYMKECRYVIADGSTVVYEALYMKRVVFAFESESSIQVGVDKLPDVHLFKDADDFMNLWKERDKFQSKCHDEFFDTNYKRNYVEFLKKCGVDVSIKQSMSKEYWKDGRKERFIHMG